MAGRSGQRRQGQEELRIGGDLQIEINEAVDGDGEAAGQRPQHDRAPPAMMRLRRDKSPCKKNHHEGKGDEAADHAAVDQRLQVIVVSLFDALRARAGIVARIGVLKSSQAHAQPGMVADDHGGRAPDIAAAEAFLDWTRAFGLAGILGDIPDQSLGANQEE